MTPAPDEIRIRKQSRLLALRWADVTAELSFEFLRVHSPSAEVRGHGQGNDVLQFGKQDVQLVSVQPVGNYGLQLAFDDGHDSGIYSWQYLHHLASQQSSLWQQYLQRLADAGQSRQADRLMFKAL